MKTNPLIRQRPLERLCQLLRDFLVEAPRIAAMPRFLPEETKPRKSFVRRLIDNWRIIASDGRACPEYTAFGMDEAGVNCMDFMRREVDEWWRLWNPIRSYYQMNFITIIDDKLLFDSLAERFGIPHVPLVAYFSPFAGILMDGRTATLAELKARVAEMGAFFLKPVDSSGGQGACKVAVGPDGSMVLAGRPFDFGDLPPDADYVIQPLIRQHPDMVRLNPDAVSTIRIATCLNAHTGAVELFCPPCVRIGQKGSATDNVCGGGCAVGLREDGSLLDFGCCRQGTNFFALRRHPGFGYAFDGLRVPFLAEAKQLVCAAHRWFRHFPVIGWDVVLTESGPIVLEMNSSIGSEVFSACHRMRLHQRLREIGMERKRRRK